MDVRYWKGSGYETPAITCQVGDGKGDTNAMTLGPATDLLTSAADGTGTPLRLVFTPTDGPIPYTHFADVMFSAMKGLAIEHVTVDYEVSKAKVF